MDKQTKGRLWASLPKEARKEVRMLWELDTMPVHPDYDPDSVAEGAAYILTELFGRHNLTSDTEPEEMLMVERKKVQEIYHQIKLELGDGGCSEYQDDVNMEKESLLKSLFGDKYMPDKLEHRLEQTSVQVEPMFSKGDKVKIVNDATHNGKIGKVINIDRSMIAVELDDGTCVVWHKRYFVRYTEPETKEPDNRQALYYALGELESASAKVRKALISLQ